MFCRPRLVLPCRERQKNGIKIRKIYVGKNLPQSGDILQESGDASPCTQVPREKLKKKKSKEKKRREKRHHLRGGDDFVPVNASYFIFFNLKSDSQIRLFFCLFRFLGTLHWISVPTSRHALLLYITK